MKKTLLAAIALFCGTLSLSAQIPTTGLVAKWSFNNNLTLDSHDTNTLTNGGAVLDTGYQGVLNTAAYFDGNTLMSANNAAFRSKSFSIATWFKIDNITDYHTLANLRINAASSPYNSYNLCIGNSTFNKLTFFFTTNNGNDLALTDTTFTSQNVWTHVALTCDYDSITTFNTNIKLYVNGSIRSQGTYTGNIIYPASDLLSLGSVSVAPAGNSLIGNLDEFYFYKRKLTPSEVATIYNGTSTGLNSFIKNQNSDIVLYPNPTSSTLNIEVKQQTLITIVNVLGEVVKTETINGLSIIDVSALHAGIYFVQDLKSGKPIKFIKE